MTPLSDLPDHAALRIVPADPPLDTADGAALCLAIDKLCQQFARENRCTAWAAEIASGGTVLLIATVGDAPLSGCSHDRLAKLLLNHEERSGRRLLSAPPIVIETSSGARCLDRAGLRQLIASGAVDGATPVLDLTVPTLGDWRRHGRRPAAGTWVSALLPRAPIA